VFLYVSLIASNITVMENAKFLNHFNDIQLKHKYFEVTYFMCYVAMQTAWHHKQYADVFYSHSVNFMCTFSAIFPS
jgi:hypothetical protein